MDWQIRIALIIVGIAVIGYIFYDYNRRKKDQIEKQRLIEKMRSSAEHVDNLGFDYTGVGNVRKSSDVLLKEQAESEGNTQRPVSVEPNYKNSVNAPVEEMLVEESISRDVELPELDNSSSTENHEKELKLSPTEQMDLTELTENEAIEVDLNKEPDLVFSLILRAKEGETFKGSEFLPILLSQGLRHGDMGIFHRHLGHVGKKPVVLYSVANAINPGTFDITNIQSFETPAFAFFMTVPGPTDPMMAYEGMVKTIKLLKYELGGQILDETKSVFTEQTYQHHKDSLQDYLIKSSIKKSKR